MKMKKLLTFILLSFVFKSVNAQLPRMKIEEVDFIKQSILIVPVPEHIEQNKYTSKISKLLTDNTKNVKRDSLFISAIKNYWTLHDSIIYVSVKTMDSLLKSNPNKYCSIVLGKAVRNQTQTTGYNKNTGKSVDMRYTGSGNSDPNIRTSSSTSTIEEINTIEIKNNNYWLMKFYLPDRDDAFADYVSAVKQMQYILKNFPNDNYIGGVINNNASKLNNVTLLLDESKLDSDLKDAQIKEIYPANFKIVNRAFIDKVIIEQDSNYAYIQFIPTVGGLNRVYNHFIVNSNDGTIYYYLSPYSPAGVKGTNLVNVNSSIKERHITKYAKGLK